MTAAVMVFFALMYIACAFEGILGWGQVVKSQEIDDAALRQAGKSKLMWAGIAALGLSAIWLVAQAIGIPLGIPTPPPPPGI